MSLHVDLEETMLLHFRKIFKHMLSFLLHKVLKHKLDLDTAYPSEVKQNKLKIKINSVQAMNVSNMLEINCKKV